MTRTHANQSLVSLISLIILGSIWQFAVGSSESRKTLEQKIIFQIGILNLHGINEHFSFN